MKVLNREPGHGKCYYWTFISWKLYFPRRRWVQGVGGSVRLILFLHPEDVQKEMVRLAVRDMGKSGHHVNEPSSSRVCQQGVRASSRQLSQCFQSQLTSSWWPGRSGICLVAGCLCTVLWPGIKGRESEWDGGRLGLEGAAGASGGTNIGLEGRETWVPILALPLTHCVTLGTVLPFLSLSLPIWEVGRQLGYDPWNLKEPRTCG